MDSAKNKRECKKHEKRTNDMLRMCETCGRRFYLCEICRTAKNIDAPSTICLRCTPALKTLRNILDKKDAEIVELQNRLKKLDTDVKTNEDLKKQLQTLKRTNEELKNQIKHMKEQVEHYKKTYEKIQSINDKIVDDFKIKEEFIQDIKSLLKTQEYVDCYINVNDGRYPAHKCIIAARSGVLKNLIEAAASLPVSVPPSSQPSPPLQIKDPKTKSKNTNQRQQHSIESQSQLVQTPKTELRSFANSNTLELKDLDPLVMPFIINYIYSGETDHITDRNVQSIMKAADMLELTGLRTSCLVFMEDKLSRLTCIPILIEAFELNHERLKKKCLQFIQDEKIDLTNSTQWVEFKNENPKLALNLYERYVKEKSSFITQLKHSIDSESSSEKGNSTSRSNHGQLNPIKNPAPIWNTSSQNTIFSNKAINNGSKKIIVDR